MRFGEISDQRDVMYQIQSLLLHIRGTIVNVRTPITPLSFPLSYSLIISISTNSFCSPSLHPFPRSALSVSPHF